MFGPVGRTNARSGSGAVFVVIERTCFAVAVLPSLKQQEVGTGQDRTS